MNESQLRELLGKGLPKIAAASINAVYPIGFRVAEEPARDYAVEAQVVGSQLLYTRNFQVCAFLVMEANHILKLGQCVFPKQGRAEGIKTVVSANGEALNTVMGKLAFLVGKVDAGAEVVTAPPIVLNCSGPNRIAVRGGESVFLRLAALDLCLCMIISVQKV